MRTHRCPEKREEVCLVELSPVLEHEAGRQRHEKDAGLVIFNETQGVLDRILGHQQVIEKQLKAVHYKVESQIKKLLALMEQKVNIVSEQISLQVAINALYCSLEVKSVSKYGTIHSQFEKLGSRYFYIETNVRMDWFSAASTCRGMGGHLATPKDEDELHVLRQKLDSKWYWLDISDLAKKDEYISLVSGEIAPFLKWNEGEPNKNPDTHCIYIYAGHYYKYFCNEKNTSFAKPKMPRIIIITTSEVIIRML
uniref:Accessory gland protein Acp29AB-like n=1 Tax=Drosophila rhopaloa TaxID=1041015 RepID=A0A6P4FE69_DRORH